MCLGRTEPSCSAQLSRKNGSVRHAHSLRISTNSSPTSMLAPSPPPSPLDRLRWLAAAGDLPSALHVWSSLRSSSSGRHGRSHPCTEAYNLVMNLYSTAGDHFAAVTTFNQMIQEGANPNSRTYTIIIDHLIRSGNLNQAIEVFHLLPSMRIRRTSKQYNVLAEALSSSGHFVDLEKLIKAMNCDGILPGRSMREAISRMRAAGHTTETKEFVKILSPDDRIGFAVEEEETEKEEEEEVEEGDGDDNHKNDDKIRVILFGPSGPSTSHLFGLAEHFKNVPD